MKGMRKRTFFRFPELGRGTVAFRYQSCQHLSGCKMEGGLTVEVSVRLCICVNSKGNSLLTMGDIADTGRIQIDGP